MPCNGNAPCEYLDKSAPASAPEGERLLRLVCANVVGTPVEKQSRELADIALALETHDARLLRIISELPHTDACRTGQSGPHGGCTCPKSEPSRRIWP